MYVYIYIYICIYRYRYICVCVCARARVCVCIHTHAHTHTHIHTYTRTKKITSRYYGYMYMFAGRPSQAGASPRSRAPWTPRGAAPFSYNQTTAVHRCALRGTRNTPLTLLHRPRRAEHRRAHCTPAHRHDHPAGVCSRACNGGRGRLRMRNAGQQTRAQPRAQPGHGTEGGRQRAAAGTPSTRPW